MKKHSFYLAFILFSFCIYHCTHENPTLHTVESAAPTSDTQAVDIAKELISKANWEFDSSSNEAELNNTALQKKGPEDKSIEQILQCKRIQVDGNIAHYELEIYVGPGPNDVIGLHRVVKEKRFCRPITTNKTFFFQHGDAKDFVGMTLPGEVSAATPKNFGIAVYLAKNDVDVWGIDQAWTKTPADISESSFMADWGLQKQINDLNLAMSIARFTRLFTGSGFAPLTLCGYSSGVVTGYALLNEETQKPEQLRNVAGFIPVDLPIKTDDETVRQVFIDEYSRVKAQMDAGEYADFMAFPLVAQLARADPEGESPVVPGFTNMQTALFFGAGPLYGTIDYHFLAGMWENELPADFEFVTIDQWLDFMAAGAPWEAAQFIADYCLMISDLQDIPFDDYFAQISVPIFLVGAAGGFGEYSLYGTSLLGSSDITSHIVQTKPADQVLFDFAHIDLFLGHNATTQVWQPILQWIVDHAGEWPS